MGELAFAQGLEESSRGPDCKEGKRRNERGVLPSHVLDLVLLQDCVANGQ